MYSDTIDEKKLASNKIQQISENILKEDNIATSEHEQKYDSLKMTVYTHPKTHTKQMMPQSWSVHTFADNILNYLENQNVMRWLNIAKSGGGKTTLIVRLLHEIVCSRNRDYHINWYSGHDLINVPKIVEGIKKKGKNRNHILVFDDSSYTLEEATQAQIGALANILTTIRHELGEKSKFLIIFNIHNSKALLKRLREAELVTCLSVTQNDRLYLSQELFNEYAVKNFAKMYRDQSLKGRFHVNIDSWNRQRITFDAKKVHIGMMNLIGKSAFFVFDKLDCQRCNKSPYYDPEEETYVTPNEILARINKTYPQSQYAKVIRFFSFYATGNDMMLNAQERKVMRLLLRVMQKTNVDPVGIVKKMNDRYLKKRKNHHWNSERELRVINELDTLIDNRIDKKVK